MAHIINEIAVKPRTLIRKNFNCLCNASKKQAPKFYDVEGVDARIRAAEQVRKRLKTEQIEREENLMRSAEALKAINLAKPKI